MVKMFVKCFLTISCLLLSFNYENEVNCALFEVDTVSKFQSALKQVSPGDLIQLADGEFNGFFRAEISGTQSAPITIQGSDYSVLSSWSSAFNLEASYYILKDFTIANAKKGILIDGGNFNLLTNLTIHTIDEEGVHFRFFSSDNTLSNSHIYNTGVTRPGYGEGVYIGQDYSKWSSESEPDRCDRNIIINNRIGPCGAENIDIKEGSCCGQIEGNYFDGSGMSNVNSDDSWVDVKGSDYQIIGNDGKFTLKDGYQVRTHMPNGGVSGCRNIFSKNKSDLTGNSGGVAIYLNSKTRCDNSTLIYSDNLVITGEDITNGWVTPI